MALVGFADISINGFDGRTFTLIGIVVNLCVVGKIICLLIHPSLLHRFFANNHSFFELLFCFLAVEFSHSFSVGKAFLFQLILAFPVLDHCEDREELQ